MTPILLTPPDLVIAPLLIVVDGVLSVALGLHLHWQLGWAATRMVVQLLLVGLVLREVFALASPALTLACRPADGRDGGARGGGAARTAAWPVRQLRRRRDGGGIRHLPHRDPRPDHRDPPGSLVRPRATPSRSPASCSATC